MGRLLDISETNCIISGESNMRDLAKRLALKLTGHKAMFTIATLAIICLVELTPENADVLKSMIFAIMGVKGVEYAAQAIRARRDEGGD
jgi:Mg2+/Co2+ transporter CorB